MPAATIVPIAVKFTELLPVVVPAKFALTFVPPAQVAVTVPATEVDDCSEITHVRSAQFAIGRPAIDDAPQAPENVDAGVPVEFPPVEDDDPVGVMVPATPTFPVGALGVSSVDALSNAQPVARIDARHTADKDASLMVRPWSSWIVFRESLGRVWKV